MCHGFQVCWIYAGSVSAKVVNYKPIPNRSVFLNIGEPVGRALRKAPISVAVVRPLPNQAIAVLNGVRPKVHESAVNRVDAHFIAPITTGATSNAVHTITVNTATSAWL
jgi:hypothetical protein